MPSGQTTFIGVDFSGSQQDNATWIAMATVAEGGRVDFQTPIPIRRSDLEQLLLTVDGPAVAALDFPFGLPADFAVTQGFIRWGEGLMDSCDRMAGTDWAEFEEVAAKYVAARKVRKQLREPGLNIEPKRASDNPPAYSPLHSGRPSMIQMTYHGMAMLGRLLARAPGRFRIPPLPANMWRSEVTLVELMPGQLLRARGDSGVGYKNGDKNLQRRHEILAIVEEWIGARLPEHVRLACRANTDCLDSVVNLAGALQWHRNPDAFTHPNAAQQGFAHDEGWLYTLRQ